jgi:hypothetical protein
MSTGILDCSRLTIAVGTDIGDVFIIGFDIDSKQLNTFSLEIMPLPINRCIRLFGMICLAKLDKSGSSFWSRTDICFKLNSNVFVARPNII